MTNDFKPAKAGGGKKLKVIPLGGLHEIGQRYHLL